MAKSLQDFEENKKPVKINGIEESYDKDFLNPKATLLDAIDTTIERFESLARTINENKNDAISLVEKSSGQYTFQITKNIYPAVTIVKGTNFDKEVSVVECVSLYFNFEKLLFVFKSDNSYNLQMIIHNGTPLNFTKSVKNEYGRDHYESKVFRLIELIEDIYDTTIENMSNGLISP